MGLSDFYHRAKGRNADEAFQAAKAEARHEYGHGGYSGSIAEKDSFVLIPLLTEAQKALPGKYASDLIENKDKRIDDKFGPAGCVKVGPDEWLFFGWASC